MRVFRENYSTQPFPPQAEPPQPAPVGERVGEGGSGGEGAEEGEEGEGQAPSEGVRAILECPVCLEVSLQQQTVFI